MKKKVLALHRQQVGRRIPLIVAGFLVFAFAASARAQSPAKASETQSWTAIGPAGEAVQSLVLDPRHPATLFAAAGDGIFKTTDAGATWEVLTASPAGALVLAIDPTNSLGIFAGTERGLQHSTDGGAHFSLLGLHTRVSAIQIDPTGSSTLYALSGSVMKSTDGGATWDRSFTTRDIAALILDPAHPSTLYAGSDADTSYYPTPAFILKSTDAAENWRFVAGDPQVPSQLDAVTAFAIDPESNGTVYAGMKQWDGGRVLRSQDAGGLWTSFRLPVGAQPSCMVIDPSRPSTLYAGTDRGVFRSADSGANWASFLDGLDNTAVSALVIDPEATVLRAATAHGVFEARLQSAPPVYPCVPGPAVLCLFGGRFQATLLADDPRTGRLSKGAAVARGDLFGYFSLPAFTGDAGLPEVLVKMVDARTLPDGDFWVFFGGLTDVAYAITITDTLTGEERTYQNSFLSPYCGGADTSAFAAGPAAPAIAPPAGQTPSASGLALDLLDGRFHVTLSATDPRTGRAGTGAPIPGGDRFGSFSLPAFTGEPDLPEVVVKMLDATSFADDFWFFFSGLTDLPYTLTVLDTETGAVRTYESPGAFCGAADTSVTRR